MWCNVDNKQNKYKITLTVDMEDISAVWHTLPTCTVHWNPILIHFLWNSKLILASNSSQTGGVVLVLHSTIPCHKERRHWWLLVKLSGWWWAVKCALGLWVKNKIIWWREGLPFSYLVSSCEDLWESMLELQPVPPLPVYTQNDSDALMWPWLLWSFHHLVVLLVAHHLLWCTLCNDYHRVICVTFIKSMCLCHLWAL